MTSVREKLAQYREGRAKERPSLSLQSQEKDVPKRTDASQLTETEIPNTGGSISDSGQPRPFSTALKLAAWFLLWGVSIELGLGVVYVVVSGLLLMFYSLYGSQRRSHEPSAYSVFNKDCENIDGTLTAAQFEKELRYGPTNVRQ